MAQPNPENKLFIGGAPPGTDEETLKKIFSEHGEVEEVFVMRGGSRSGQACAFVRFMTAEGAVAAIQAIHGKYVMSGCTDPLVVRYADAPGSRAKKGSGRHVGGFNGYGNPPGYGSGGGGYGGNMMGNWPGGPYAAGGWGGPPFGGFGGGAGFMPPPYGMGGPASAMSNFSHQGGQQGVPPQQQGMVQQQPAMMARVYGMGAGAQAGPKVTPQTPAVVSGKPVEGAADWAAYTAPDGRSYYYNAKTGVSTWDKPGAVNAFGF